MQVWFKQYHSQLHTQRIDVPVMGRLSYCGLIGTSYKLSKYFLCTVNKLFRPFLPHHSIMRSSCTAKHKVHCWIWQLHHLSQNFWPEKAYFSMGECPNGLDWNVSYRVRTRPGGRNWKKVGQMLDKGDFQAFFRPVLSLILIKKITANPWFSLGLRLSCWPESNWWPPHYQRFRLLVPPIDYRAISCNLSRV